MLFKNRVRDASRSLVFPGNTLSGPNLSEFFMSGETTISDWEDYGFTDYTDRSLLTDFTERLKQLSSKSREKRRQEELLEELVREHIEGKSKPTSLIKSILGKLLERI
jgi:hypothetical protein